MSKLVAYANGVLVRMYGYVMDTIIERELHFKGGIDFLKARRDSLMHRGRGSEIDPMHYFIMKTAYGGDIG